MENKEVIEALQKKFSASILDVSAQFGDEIVLIDKAALVDIAGFLKEQPYEFSVLLDLTCVDYPDNKTRFEMVYHFFSLSQNLRLRVKAGVKESDLTIDSLTVFWKNANWLEREVFDMFGIRFNNHPDLRRLFMYDGFEGHPLRKDYPLRKQQPCIKLRNTDAD
jgi:NADH-quinone oxidoreductase subunit C